MTMGEWMVIARAKQPPEEREYGSLRKREVKSMLADLRAARDG